MLSRQYSDASTCESASLSSSPKFYFAKILPLNSCGNDGYQISSCQSKIFFIYLLFNFYNHIWMFKNLKLSKLAGIHIAKTISASYLLLPLSQHQNQLQRVPQGLLEYRRHIRLLSQATPLAPVALIYPAVAAWNALLESTRRELGRLWLRLVRHVRRAHFRKKGRVIASSSQLYLRLLCRRLRRSRYRSRQKFPRANLLLALVVAEPSPLQEPPKADLVLLAAPEHTCL